MESFVYKCPNCGGNVKYSDTEHKWYCEYCKNTYSSLFAQEENPLPNYEELKLTLFGYTCPKCNRKYVSRESKNAQCTYCLHEENLNGIPFSASGIVDVSYSDRDALEGLRKEAKGLNPSLFNEKLKLQYINCDLYNGCIVLSYDNVVEKYILVNLLVPNIEYEDYRFMYEVGNIGFTNSFELSSIEKSTVENKFILKGEYINSFIDKNYEQDILNYCVNSFAKQYQINDISQIKVQKIFNVKDGFYVPFYVSKVNINNEDCYDYVFATNRMIKRFDKRESTFTILELPSVPQSRKNTKFYNILYNISSKLTFFCAFALLILFHMSNFMLPNYNSFNGQSDTFDKKILIYIDIVLIIIFSLIWHFSYKKYRYYEKTIKLSKEDYFDQIINNSNFVKRIKVKK